MCEKEFATCNASQRTCHKFKNCMEDRRDALILNFQAQEEHRKRIMEQNGHKPVVLEEELCTQED